MGTWTHLWTLLCSCFFASHTTYSFILTQSPGLTHVSVGGSVELRCIFEQTVKYCFNAAAWEKLNLRTGKLTTVNTNHENKVRQHDDKTCVLTLNNLSLKDSGMFYCISHYNQMAVIGNGSRVIVSVSRDWTCPVSEEWNKAAEIQCFAEYDGESISKTLTRSGPEPEIFSWLVYAGCVAALLTILITVIMSVGLYRDMLMTKKSRRLTRKEISYGKQSTLREESSPVLCFSGDPISHGQDVGTSKE